MTAPTIRAELAAAYRAISAAYDRLPVDVQNSIEIGYDALEAEVDAATLAEDRERAMRAISAWKRHWLATFEEAGR